MYIYYNKSFNFFYILFNFWGNPSWKININCFGGIGSRGGGGERNGGERERERSWVFFALSLSTGFLNQCDCGGNEKDRWVFFFFFLIF